jgi:4-oxalocrotonate tautomerase
MPRFAAVVRGAVHSFNTETTMPLVDIQLIEGVFSAEEKQKMISKITDVMIEIEGETMREVTWVRVQEFKGGAWAIGGQSLTAADVKAMQKKAA